ncbi:MAG: hypothetical protein SGPRY_006453, partial [Prymnesium sp.]
ATGAQIQVNVDGSTTLSTVSEKGMRRFAKVVTASFATAFLSFFLVAAFGFLTFGSASAGGQLMRE